MMMMMIIIIILIIMIIIMMMMMMMIDQLLLIVSSILAFWMFGTISVRCSPRGRRPPAVSKGFPSGFIKHGLL